MYRPQLVHVPQEMVAVWAVGREKAYDGDAAGHGRSVEILSLEAGRAQFKRGSKRRPG